jgi:AraC family transcriptional regulator
MTYRVLIIDKAFFAENAIDLDGIHFSTRFRDPLLSEAIEELNEFFKLPEDAPWRTLLIRSKIMSILERLCSGHSEGYDKTRGEREELLSAIKHAIGIIHARYSERLTLESLATEIGISKYYFSRKFHRLTGYSPISYLNLTRCENAKLLLTRQKSIMEVAEAVGYEDQSYFTRIFRRTIGITPTEYKQLR